MTGPGSDHIAQIYRDLTDVEAQVTNGELDRTTADQLIETYRSEIATISAEDRNRGETPRDRSGRRMAMGATILVVAFIAITWAASGSIIDRSPTDLVGPERTVDLDAVSNEQMIDVINANADLPEVNRMRLALAERYFEDRLYSDAFTWFQAVLDADPTTDEESEALARLAWMLLESGEPETAERFLEMALEANPLNLEAVYFRALLYARTDRTAEALVDLQTVSASPNIPDDIRLLVDEAIAVLEERP